MLTPIRVLYLHGFASGPASRKARFFAAQLGALGFPLEIPDLAQADFEHLTITNQLRVVEQAAGDGGPVILIGSSLGGYLAALYAARHPAQVDRLILLAPAFAFHQLWLNQLGPEKLRRWREMGSVPVFHYGEGREMNLAFGFIEDAAQFEGFPDFAQPGLIFHGVQDAVVPLKHSEVMANTHPNIRLIRLTSGHELTDVLDEIWNASKDFILSAGVG